MPCLRLAFAFFLLAAAGWAAAADAPAAQPCQVVSAGMFCPAALDGNASQCWAESPRFRVGLDGSCPAAEKLQLVLDGQRLAREAAMGEPGAGNTVDFRVSRDHRDFLALKPLVAQERKKGMARVSVGAAVVDGPMLPAADGKALPQVEVRLYDKAELLAALIVLLALVAAVAGVFTGLLRDGGYDPSAFPPRQRTFSLARVQLFIWSTLILVGFVFIWLLTGLDSGVVTAELLGAYGIATATAAGGILQDKATRTATSRGFLADILSDEGDTPSIHRLQMFAWTVVLAVIFILEVWRNLRMPVFDNVLLSLMGISGSAYVGLKTLEQKA